MSTAAPASAAAYGCTVARWATPPSIVYNTGGAKCDLLTDGSAVRAKVWCGTLSLPPRYGVWTYRSNTYSRVDCTPIGVAKVEYEITP